MNDYEEVTIRIARELIPEGWEIDGIRLPQQGEYVLSSKPGKPEAWRVTYPYEWAHIVIRRKWNWPPWLKCDRIKWSDTLGWYGEGDTLQARIAFEFLNWPEPPDRTKVYRNPKNS